ncbi:B12-binding domain-containing radical SAM protein [Candidatus Thiosymbion oneisti]|uniref:B12-binding domain-containing radical SAM protein n=1 Tax=Candidatus Thiosymbion oneisti TaxID=589554 RepID=UPI000B7DACC1|nr:radical SAM protein [Candidatus Thiosymbion oneisti]
MTQKPKITLITVDQYGPSLGVRFLSAVLKRAGYQTVVVFANGYVSREAAMGKVQIFPDHIHNEIAKLVAGSLYIGISVVTPTYHRAKEITIQIKSRINIPIVWGGVHATVSPDECLEYADMVCMGEGEDLVVDLANRLRENRTYDNIPGLRLPNQLPVTYIAQTDISHIPSPDYAFDGSHYIVDSHGITRISSLQTYKRLLAGEYNLSPTRGCPYKCTYCVNDRYSAIHKDAKIRRFRARNLDNVIRELIWAKNHFAFSHAVIPDDCFMALKRDDIRYFVREYKKHIGLPFKIHGADTPSVTEEKLKLLCDAGLVELRIGIQTGSERIRKLYGRTWESNTSVLKTAHLINHFINQGQLRWVLYYIILDNPWESKQDQVDTFKLVASLPRPFSVTLFSLTFYPGTSLYERALSEKLIRGDATDDAYWKNYKKLRSTPINETLGLMVYLPLSSTAMWWLVKDKPVTKYSRRIIKKLVASVPEVTLFFKSRARYEIELCIQNTRGGAIDVFRQLKKNPSEYSGGSRRPVIVALRLFLLSIYIKASKLRHPLGTHTARV